MSDDYAAQIEARLDQLAQRRNVERFLERVGYVIQALMIALGIWVGSAIIDLKTVAVDLSGKLTAAAQLSDLKAATLIERMQRIERHLESIDGRLLTVERQQRASIDRGMGR